MQITPYHAKYFAFELTKRNSSDSLQKLASSLLDAQVDLNPHQVENEHTTCPSQEGNKMEISQEGKEHTPNPLSRGEYKSPLLGGDLGVGSHIRYLINHIAQKQQTEILQMNTERNAGFFNNEMEKLDKWAEDVKGSMEIELKELDKEIKCRKTEAKKS